MILAVPPIQQTVAWNIGYVPRSVTMSYITAHHRATRARCTNLSIVRRHVYGNHFHYTENKPIIVADPAFRNRENGIPLLRLRLRIRPRD